MATFVFQVLGSHEYQSTPPSLLIHQPVNARILINAGENTQRLSTQFKLKLAKVEDIIITHVCPDYVGGLPGLLLTIESLEKAGSVLSNPPKKIRKTDCDPSVKFGETYVINQWLQTSTSPGVIQHFRPITKSTENLNLEGADAAALLQKLNDWKHTMRWVRIWGPRGIGAFIRSLTASCGRLSRLSVEVFEFQDAKPFTLETKDYSLNLLIASLDHNESHNIPEFVPKWKRPCTITAPNSAKSIGNNANTTNPVLSNLPSEDDLAAASLKPTLSLFDSITSCVPVVFGRSPKHLGRFLIDKAKALKIPAGKQYAALKKGESVELADGRIIQPLDVCEPTEDGVLYCCIFCRTENDIECLQRCINEKRDGSDAWTQFLDDVRRESGERPVFLFHMLAEELYSSQTYTDLRSLLGSKGNCLSSRGHDSTKGVIDIHVIRDSRRKYATPFTAAGALSSFLSSLIPSMFAVDGNLEKHSSNSIFNEIGDLGQIKVADPRFWKQGFSTGVVQGVDVSLDQRKRVEKLLSNVNKNLRQKCLKDSQEFVHCLEKAISINPLIEDDQCHDSRNDKQRLQEGSIILLGTGAALPSRYRNVSSSLVQLDAENAIMLDCGEGTTTQLFECSANHEEFVQKLAAIQLVFLSHRHADHIVGLMRLVHVRKKLCLRARKLTVYAPSDICDWLQYICGDKIELHSNESILQDPVTVTFQDPSTVFDLQTCLVNHIRIGNTFRGCFAVKVTLAQGTGIVYSGDLEPSEQFSNFTNGAGIIIHEATFDNELEWEARKRHHSTVGECVKAGIDSGCELLIMTHFSQRYPSAAAIEKLIVKESLCVCYGMDMSLIPFKHLLRHDGSIELEQRALVHKHLNECLKDVKCVLSSLNSVLTEEDNMEDEETHNILL